MARALPQKIRAKTSPTLFPPPARSLTGRAFRWETILYAETRALAQLDPSIADKPDSQDICCTRWGLRQTGR